MPDDDAGLGTLAVVGLRRRRARHLVRRRRRHRRPGSPTSPTDRMYLATSAWSDAWAAAGGRDIAVRPHGPADGRPSRSHAFELDGTDATYVASGEVDGAIADRWSMDEYDGVLRVAVGPTMSTGNFNSIVTLDEDGDDLVEIGRVDELGVDETIRSMRWFDDLAIMVTFRQVDPLYAVDLTDPDVPGAAGRAQDPRLLRVPPPARVGPPDRRRPGRQSDRDDPGRAGRAVRRLRPDRSPSARRRDLRPRHHGRAPAPTRASSPGCPTGGRRSP